MLVVVLAVGFFLLAHTWLVDRHLTFTSGVYRADHPIHTPLQRIRASFTADVNMWIRYALDLLEGKESLRSHHTSVDNPPNGREVHWNSALTWWIASLGWGIHQITGLPLAAAVERGAVWANLPLVFAFVAGFGWWAGRRAGALAGALVAIGIVGHRSIYEGFLPAYPDHHGLIAAGLLGLMLGFLFMGGGWLRGTATPAGLQLLPADEKSAISAARWAGFWGGFGLWISTASLAVPIAMLPLAGLLATLLCHRSLAAAGARSHPATWRAWGRAGALTSLAFYLFEYFPHHLSWRLEVNHPLYALAWLAGGELTAAAHAWLTADAAARRDQTRRLLRTAAWAVPAGLAPAIVIFIWRTKVFLPLDPFLARLHSTIAEFLPFQTRLMMGSVMERFDYLFIHPVFYLLAIVLLCVGPRAQRYGVILCLVPALALQALGFWQGRWAMSTGPMHVPLLLVCLACLYSFAGLGATATRRWLVGTAAAVFFFLPAPVYYFSNLANTLRRNAVPVDETMEIVNREIAQAIRDSQPQGPIVLYASPNASVSLGYFGRFQTVGTLYWENTDGLKAAAALCSAPGEAAAAEIIRRLGITHLAFISRDNYVEEYNRFYRPGITDEQIKASFGYQILGKGQIPVWLEPVLYAPPPNLPGDLAGLRVILLKVNFAQNETTLYYRLGLLLALQGQPKDALERFARAAQLDPKSPEPWFRRGEILLSLGNYAEASASIQRGVSLSAPSEHYRILTQSGVAFDRGPGIPYAMDLYRLAIQGQMTNAIALNNLAWRLATNARPELRDPTLALQYATNARTIEPADPGVYDTFAAALAANNRFPEAVFATEQAIALAIKSGDNSMVPAYQRHQAAYKSGLPWRE